MTLAYMSSWTAIPRRPDVQDVPADAHAGTWAPDELALDIFNGHMGPDGVLYDERAEEHRPAQGLRVTEYQFRSAHVPKLHAHPR